MTWGVPQKAIGQACHSKTSGTKWEGRWFLMDEQTDGSDGLNAVPLSTPQYEALYKHNRQRMAIFNFCQR